MSKMDEGQLLRFLQTEADAAYHYLSGPLSEERERGLRSYMREPYGTEQDGRSQVIASDTFDTVEGMLPDQIEVFISTDKAVVFDPVGPEDVEGAKQATDACNYVFYKQNNGFMVLYTAAKDGLMMKTGAVKWYWEETNTPNFTSYRNVSEMQLAVFLASNPKAEILSKEEAEVPPEVLSQAQAFGVEPPKVYSLVKVKTVEKKGVVKVINIPPDELQVSRRHNSILLADAPYVAHVREQTVSEIRELGYDVTVDEVKAAKDEPTTQDRELREMLKGGRYGWWDEENEEDETNARGWLREEYVLVDFDGDGIAERRKITRLGQKILENVEFSHVPIAAWTPYILTHRFEGLSVADLTEDFQRISTDVMRAQLDNLELANNQESVVLTDQQGAPKANIDDLLNRRPGGVIRESVAGAVRPYVENWRGIEAMPMIDLLDRHKERRTGYSPVVQGIDADALSKTATEVSKASNDKQKRQKLMARIMAEALVAPMFRGIFKTLTDYCMEKLSFRLNGQFVQYDPQEWRDQYDMTVNVGIGSGDKLVQGAHLNQIMQAQLAIMQTPFAAQLINAETLYNTQTRIAENAGFKNPGEFWTDPKTVPPPQPQPNPQIQLEQVKIQGQMQIKELELRDSAQKFQAEQMLQQQTDTNRQEVEARQKTLEQELDAQSMREEREYNLRLEAIKQQAESERNRDKLQFERWKVEFVETNKQNLAQQSALVSMTQHTDKMVAQKDANDAKRFEGSDSEGE